MEGESQEQIFQFDEKEEIFELENEIPKQLEVQSLEKAENPRQKLQDEGLNIRQKKHSQLLYIIFTNYRKNMEQIAKKYGCIVRISMSTYMISINDSSMKQQFQQCCIEIGKFVNSIKYENLTDSGKNLTKNQINQKMRYCHSPYFIQQLRKNSIGIIIFHDKLYAYSLIKNNQQIRQTFLSITKNKLIFPVKYNNNTGKFKQLSKDLFNKIDKYLEAIFKHYRDFFEQRKVIVELNTIKSFIYVIGEKQKFLMESKITIKNSIQSMVCLIVKDTNIDQKSLIPFLKKASGFPIQYGRLGQTRSIIISKDNILKQLITKSKNFFKHLGVGLAVEDQVELQIPKFGIFIIRSPTYKIKIQNVQATCRDKGYDLNRYGNIHYVSQVFFQNGNGTTSVLCSLLGSIMETLQDYKQKFESVSQLKAKQEPQNKNSENSLKYYIKGGGRILQENLSKIFKRDVMVQKVQMKKEYLIAFNIMQTQQKTQYWRLLQSGQEGTEVKESQLTPGRYLRGLKKIGQNNTTTVIFHEIITVI